ncbi:hypothetical protein MNBD_NITROSPINAE03-1829, partial [hydrothermal vent metagenome]
MEIESIRPFLAVAVSLLGAVFIVATRKSPSAREGVSLASSLLMFIIVLSMIPEVLAGKVFVYSLLTINSAISISFRVDAMGLLFAITAAFLWLMITIYSIGYLRALKEHAQTRYYLCFAMALSASMGVAFASNLLTLYLSYELVGFFYYPLVVHKGSNEAFVKGNRYVFYIFVLGKIFMLASFLAYGLAGTLDLNPKGIFPAGIDTTLLTITFLLFLVGISKAAMVPF